MQDINNKNHTLQLGKDGTGCKSDFNDATICHPF